MCNVELYESSLQSCFEVSLFDLEEHFVLYFGSDNLCLANNYKPHFHRWPKPSINALQGLSSWSSYLFDNETHKKILGLKSLFQIFRFFHEKIKKCGWKIRHSEKLKLNFNDLQKKQKSGSTFERSWKSEFFLVLFCQKIMHTQHQPLVAHGLNLSTKKILQKISPF